MNTDRDLAKSLMDELDQLAKEGTAFLESLTGVQEQAEAFRNEEKKHRPAGRFLTDDQRRKARELQERHIQFGNRLLPAIGASALLDGSDVQHIRGQLRASSGVFELKGNYFDDRTEVWRTYDFDLDRANAVYEQFTGAVRKLLPMVAPSAVELASTIPSQRTSEVQRYRPNTAFLMMQIDDSIARLEDVKRGIQTVCKEFGIEARRADDIEHSDTITNKILDEIATSEFLIADLTGERPSVYYEVGYAHAIGKRVILYREEGTKLHFDLLVHNVPTYRNVTDLMAKLRKRLEAITGRV